ncbi:AIR synthase related protein [Brockia lithotrophica]|uniref:Phosphoribosylformylglycinamidine synthase subunit PurL n=1 Tax=Brockia lithotrophica TaxID=933949 RepID=A0A660L1L5_9BACL|nr:AIR synthase related protein [Brockia lithotrophica]RKQ84747.1 phosphoribosylformylglycinamidine synthase [Brockia lithotrophica]
MAEVERTPQEETTAAKIAAALKEILTSEHMSYRHTKRLLALLPREGPHVLAGPGEGAGVVAADGNAAAFKIESHNHPSKIDPYAGSATGIGGLYRDVFTMGAEPRLAAALLRVGPAHLAEEVEFTRTLVRGFAEYVAEFGVGEGAYVEYAADPSYAANPLVNVFALGEIVGPRLSARGGRDGDVLVYAGRPVDGAGYEAAAFASRAFASEEALPPEAEGDSADAPPLVPPADPRMGRRVMDALLAAARRGWVVAVQDMGAGGVAGSAAELASRGPGGVVLDLEHVPRMRDFPPEVLLLAETQERVLVVADPAHVEELLDHFRTHQVPAAVVGRLVSSGTFAVRRGDALLAEVPLAELTDVAPVVREDVLASVRAAEEVREAVPQGSPDARPERAEEELVFPEERELLAQIGLVFLDASTVRDLLQRYFTSPRFPRRLVRRREKVRPDGGKGAEPPLRGWAFDDVAFVDVGSEPPAAWGMSGAGEGNAFALDAYGAAQMAVFAALRSLAVRGLTPLGLSDNLNFGSPERDDVYRSLVETVLGFSAAARAASVPFVSGNVSLYNETAERGILPTPLLVAFGSSPRPAVPGTWDEEAVDEAAPVFLVGSGPLRLLPFLAAAYGAEELRARAGEILARVSRIPLAPQREGEERLRSALARLYADGSFRHGILAARAVREGGALGALLQMATSSGSGVALGEVGGTALEGLALLFGEGAYGVFVVRRAAADDFCARARGEGLRAIPLGEVRREGVEIGGISVRLGPEEIGGWLSRELALLGLVSPPSSSGDDREPSREGETP